MSDNDDRDLAQQPAPGSREARKHNNWLSEPNDVTLGDRCHLNDVGNNLNTNTSENHVRNIAQQQVNFNLIIQSTRYEQPEARESPQDTYRPVAPDSHGSTGFPQIAPVQQPSMPLQTNDSLPTLPSDSGNPSEPEATAHYTDPDVPSDSLPGYPQTSRSRTHIYHFEMLTHRAGYPLYMPTPSGGLPEAHRKSGIRVGDVGVITANGAFDFRFNACQSDEEIDPPVSPLLQPRIATNKKFGPDTYLASDDVIDIRANRDSPHTFQLEKSSDAGAVLALPKGATVYEERDIERFRMHASHHALTWYTYMLKEGMNISNGSLYFVTECTKSVNWGIAVFYARPRANDNIQLIFDGESFRWDCLGKVEAKVGPESTDIVVCDGGEPKDNQCVFLRGYKIMLRSDIWNELTRTTIGISNYSGCSSPQITRISHSPSSGTSSSQTDSSYQSMSNNRNTLDPSCSKLQAKQLTGMQAVLQGSPSNAGCAAETSSEPKTLKEQELKSQVREVILEEFFSETAPLHPSDLINAMLLHLKPEAKVAITHDSEWCDHLPDDFIANPTSPNVNGLLENINQSCKAVVDQYGSAVLEDLGMDSEVQHDLHSSQATKLDHLSHIMTIDPSLYFDTEQNFSAMTEIHSKAAQSPPNLKHSSALFTGRKEYLMKLRDYFSSRTGGSRKSCLLYGIGGIGKTQICLKFIEQKSDLFSDIFWIDASSEKSIELGLMHIGEVKNSSQGPKQSARSVLHWISQRTNWLVVYDGADGHYQTVEEFLPPGNGGNILITSRNLALKRITLTSLEVLNLPEEEAVTLLLESGMLDGTSNCTMNLAKILASELGGIPLALDQAGVYMLTSQCGIDNYLELYTKQKKELMSNPTSDYFMMTTYGTWDISIKKVEEMAARDTGEEALAAQSAMRILRIFCFLDHVNIPEELFKNAAENYVKRDIDEEVKSNYPLSVKLLDDQTLFLGRKGVWEEWKFLAGIHVLISFSLIEAHNKLYSMNLMVHTGTRNRIPKTELTKYYEKARALLSCSVVLDYDFDNYAFCKLLAPHIRSNALHASELKLKSTYYDDEHERFTLVFHHVGSWDEMEKLLLVTAHWRKTVLGANQPKTLACIANLASAYRNQGRLIEAEKLELDVISARKAMLGPDHQDTLSSMANLALTYLNQGRWDEAEKLFVEAMNAFKAKLGSDHPVTLSSMANLASTYLNQGRWDEAETLFMEAMNAFKAKLGLDHPATLSSMANLASTYLNQGRWVEAEKLQVEVMNARDAKLGSDHPSTLTSMVNLASTYRNQGRWDEAEKLQVEAMNARKAKLGSEHPATLTSMANLASTYRNQGRWVEAEELEVEVMNAREAKLGSYHPDSLSSMANLASTYRSQGRWDEAEKLEVEVMNARKAKLGSYHPDTLSSMANLSSTYRNQGRWDEAEKLEVEVMNTRKAQLGSDHPDTLSSMANLASTYLNQERWDEAEKLFVEVMNARKAKLGSDHPATLTSMANLASTYLNQGRWDEAEKLEVEVMNVRKVKLGSDHPDTLSSMANLSSTYWSQGRLDEAHALLSHVVKMMQQVMGSQHPTVLHYMQGFDKLSKVMQHTESQ